MGRRWSLPPPKSRNRAIGEHSTCTTWAILLIWWDCGDRRRNTTTLLLYIESAIAPFFVSFPCLSQCRIWSEYSLCLPRKQMPFWYISPSLSPSNYIINQSTNRQLNWSGSMFCMYTERSTFYGHLAQPFRLEMRSIDGRCVVVRSTPCRSESKLFN